MSERRTDEISRELRATAPPAPDGVRERVRAIAAREGETTRRRSSLRVLALAAAAALALLTVGAALVPRLTNDDAPRTAVGPPPAPEQTGATRSLERRAGATTLEALDGRAALPPAQRLQDYRAAITLRVDDADELSSKAQQAMRDARLLGGFVASVDFSTESEEGSAKLVLRVPVARIQEAVATFSELGAILAQDVVIQDLQPRANRMSSSLAQHKQRIAELTAKERRTPAEEAELRSRRNAVEALTRQLRRLTNEARYATVSLELTTAASERGEEPGAIGKFWDDASKILVTELIWLLYTLVVAGPFVLLALLAVLAERARRRRSADALLAHH